MAAGGGPLSERAPRYASLLADLDLAGFRAIAAVLREGVVLLDTDLRIRDLNPAAERILGRSAEELVGLPVCSLFGEFECPEDTLAASLRGGRAILDFQTTVRLPGDRRGQVLVRTAPLQRRQGGGEALAMILGDVTEETQLRRQSQLRSSLGGLVGRDGRMRELFDLIERVAPSDATVLIRGESGTGKELVARAVHDRSRRAAGPFVAVNCSALAETLLESELFGHVRGAYTGAVADRRGRFEEARGGTIFLDEIGDVSPAVQVKLLRVLQERVVERVGDSRPVPVDVRVVSATNRDLEHLLASGRLREDFYYRLKVVRLDIPPLRERREDIPALADHLLARHGHDAVTIAPDALARLMRHDWPGNVRELENALEHALVLSPDRILRREHLPPEIGADAVGNLAGLHGVARGSAQERQRLLAALQATGWNRTRAARRLGIDRTTLWRKLKEHGLRRAP
jgi:two-component system, NtrC family, response regulator HydG